MYFCKVIRKNLSGYFCDILKEEEKIRIQTHIKNCPSCFQEFGKVKTLFELLSKKEYPHPSMDFWQDFSKGLDKKLSATIPQQSPVSVAERIRQILAIPFQPALRPALAVSFVVLIIASSALFLRQQRTTNIKHQPAMLALLDDEGFTEELDILYELDSEQDTASEENISDDSLNDLEEILYELDRWEQLS